MLINEDQECITDPLVYMEVILLFRRLKGLLKKRYSRTCAITLAARIKPPCNLISWLMSLDVKDVNGLKYKTIAKQLMKNKLPETLLKKVRDVSYQSLFEILFFFIFMCKITNYVKNISSNMLVLCPKLYW